MTNKTTQLLRLAAAALLIVAGMGSCEQEERLNPDFNNPSDNFAPSPDDSSDEAQLRRHFHELTGCYLLFTDTLQHRLLGNDINGQPRYFTETIDLAYTVGQSSSTTMRYTFSFLQQYAQKQQVTDFLVQYVLPHLTKDLKPYSWMVCNIINSYKDTYSGSVSHPYAACNQRCVVVAGNYLVQRERTEQQMQQYAQRILNAIVGQLAVNQSAAFGSFYQYSAEWYETDYSAAGIVGKPSNDDLYQRGFLSSTGISSFPSMTTDLGTYALLVIQYSDEQLLKTYASYPLILQKAKAVREVLLTLGYVF